MGKEVQNAKLLALSAIVKEFHAKDWHHGLRILQTDPSEEIIQQKFLSPRAVQHKARLDQRVVREIC